MGNKLNEGSPLPSDWVGVPREPTWIVNDLGELGVMVDGVPYFLYKGDNIVYDEPNHEDGTPMMYRIVGKREFGETVWPRKWIEAGRREDRYTQKLYYAPGLSDGKPEDGDWRPLPAVTRKAAPSAPAEGSRTVEDDVRAYGTGYTLDGQRIDPSRITVVTAPEPLAQSEAVAFRYVHVLDGDSGSWQPIENLTPAYRKRLEDDGCEFEYAYAYASPQPAAEGESFQVRVSEWMSECFIPSLYSNMTKRGDRLLEEVLELLQATGYDRNRVATLTDYVFNRRAGEPSQEVGGVMVTLAGFCWIAGLDMHADGERELSRITQPEVMAKIRRKQEAKNALHFDTPLPGHDAPTPPQPSASVGERARVDTLALEVARRFTQDTEPQRRASLQVAVIEAIESALTTAAGGGGEVGNG